MTDAHTGAERLRILADTLAKAVAAGHYKLNMSQWVGADAHWPEPAQCGTAGCAIGFCPVAFPEDWRYALQDHHNPELRSSPNGWSDVYDEAQTFFGLNPVEVRGLFSSNAYGRDHDDPDLGGVNLPMIDRVINRIREQATYMERHS